MESNDELYKLCGVIIGTPYSRTPTLIIEFSKPRKIIIINVIIIINLGL